MTRTAIVPVLLALALAGPSAAAPYTTLAGPERAEPSFVVTYEGAGSSRTTFHATPPNDGGDRDTNDARDTSKQAWDLRFQRALEFPDCAGAALDGSSPCASVTGLNGARGATTMAGVVNHKHVDGLDRRFNRRVKCGLRAATSAKSKVQASIAVRYLSDSNSFGVSARNPVGTAIDLFTGHCPKQGDSIDRVLDFYATPGFSFADSYGPDRWFTSAEVVIPSAVFHRSAKIKIPLTNTRAGRPPKDCAVRDASFERCRTSGTWAGVLVFTLREP